MLLCLPIIPYITAQIPVGFLVLYLDSFFFEKRVYIAFVISQERLLRNGTTTAAYFGTIHLEGSKILADVVHDKGQRALIGKVNMMRNCPEYYREMSVQESIRDTEEFIRYVRSIQVSRRMYFLILRNIDCKYCTFVSSLSVIIALDDIILIYPNLAF